MSVTNDCQPDPKKQLKTLSQWWDEVKHLDRIWWMVENGNPANSSYPPSVGIHMLQHVSLYDVKPQLETWAISNAQEKASIDTLTKQCESIIITIQPTHEEMGPDLFLAKKSLTNLLVNERAPLLTDLFAKTLPETDAG